MFKLEKKPRHELEFNFINKSGMPIKRRKTNCTATQLRPKDFQIQRAV